MSPLIGGSMQENIPRVRQNGSILQTSLLHTQEMDASRLALLCDEVSLANKPQASGACRSTGLAWLSVEQGKDIVCHTGDLDTYDRRRGCRRN